MWWINLSWCNWPKITNLWTKLRRTGRTTGCLLWVITSQLAGLDRIAAANSSRNRYMVTHHSSFKDRGRPGRSIASRMFTSRLREKEASSLITNRFSYRRISWINLSKMVKSLPIYLSPRLMHARPALELSHLIRTTTLPYLNIQVSSSLAAVNWLHTKS